MRVQKEQDLSLGHFSAALTGADQTLAFGETNHTDLEFKCVLTDAKTASLTFVIYLSCDVPSVVSDVIVELLAAVGLVARVVD